MRMGAGFHPSRTKGQSFLRDERYVARIVEAIAPKPDETLLEIGAGAGQLTIPLARAGARVIALESDARLAAELRRSVAADGLSDRVEIVEKDALRVDFPALLEGRDAGRMRACGNLPYSVASPILLRLLASSECFRELVLMFQSEVAERITAKPGTKAYGFLSVVSQRIARVGVLFRIPPDAFWPRPRVVSALLRFELGANGAPDVGDERIFRSLVRGLLAHRRKTISNNVKRLGPSRVSRESIDSALKDMGIDPTRRAETLEVAEFAELSRICSSRR
jgi:16S rRNA (adenine1518-N6/adenine1519-N6)-dimethyltransferase